MSSSGPAFLANFSGPVPTPAPQTSALTVLITGASRGLGLELVKQYSTAYASNVVIAAVRSRSAKSSAEVVAYAAAHKNVHVIELDVGSESSIRASIKQLPVGVEHIDILYNNAGLFGPTGDLSSWSAAGMSELLSINVIAPLLVTQTYLPLLRKAKEPKTVLLGSIAGSTKHTEFTVANLSLPYGLSKNAGAYLWSALRYSAPDVAFINIHPGWVQTDMGGLDGKASPPVQLVDSIKAVRATVHNKSIKDSGLVQNVIDGQVIPF